MIENRFHDGRYFNRPEWKDKIEKRKKIAGIWDKIMGENKEMEDKKVCQYCGKSFHYQGIGTHEYRCPKNPHNDYSILKELEKMHPDIIRLIDAEQLKEEIIKEMWKKRNKK